ncbi:AAA family ATPase [Flavobacterium tructae]|uniref:McrB family protein n=1 Tax=Flavobacterium tructae TaxID=1114873 RepID=UPI0035A9221A
MRKFYSCSVGEEGKNYDKENLARIIDKQAFILHEGTSQKGVYSSILKDDILLLKYRGKFIAYGEALEIKQTDDKPWCLYAPIKEWYFFDKSNPSSGIEIYGMQGATLAGNQYGTVKPLECDFSLKKIKRIDKDSQLFITIKKEFQKQKEEKAMQDKIDLLEYKKQIILQGPPGTGKTRLAKMMAEEMTKVNKLPSPIQLINDFLKNYVVNSDIQNNRVTTDALVNKFRTKFKAEDIANLSLGQYALGTEEKDGFCYWLEYVLKGTGKYNGPADKGRIYYNRKEQKYVKSGFLEGKDDLEAMRAMAKELDEIISQNFSSRIDFHISKNFVLKILNTYFPDIYFPINSEHCLNNVLKIFEEDYSSLNYIEKNKKVQSLFIAKKEEFNCDITNYEFMYFLFANFTLKKEVKLENNELIIEGDYKIIQFHPSYSYEDFVRGISAKTNDKGHVSYKVENRILVDFANDALENPNAKYVLIIDEINRANLPSVLGELIYALEYRYSHENNNIEESSVESVYDISENEEEPDRHILLPDNLFIIGTMNTADRSVGHIDYAIKRRFAFVDVLPTDQAIDDVIKDQALNTLAKNLFYKVALLFNEDTSKPIFLQSDFKAKDVQLGHSYFLAETEKQLELKLNFEIKPLLNEYIKDGILSEEALPEIAKL